MSVAAAIYGNVQKEMKEQTTTSTSVGDTGNTRQNLGILNLKNHMIENTYGSPDVFTGEFLSINNDDDRKRKVFESASEHLQKYIADAEENKDSADYSDLISAKEALAAIGNGDLANWDKFKTASYKLKWNPGEFLINTAERTKFDTADEATKVKTAQDQAKTFTNTLIRKGFSTEQATEYANAGYTEEVPARHTNFNGKDVSGTFNAFLKEKEAIILRNPTTGAEMFVNPISGMINATGQEFDPYNQLFGMGWAHNPDTGAVSFGKGKYSQEDWGNVGVQLRGSAQGYEG
ncbi:MAG: hypothetical protein ACOH2V_01265 [Candidatus Saccharimonadaceae bacterium]